MRTLTRNEEWIIRRLVEGPNSPHKLWKTDAPCTDQQVSNILHRLEHLGLVHGDNSKSPYKGPGRGRKYWLDKALQDFLPTSLNEAGMSQALKILGQAVRIREHKGVQWYTALTLALINHLVISGRPSFRMKDLVKENLHQTVSAIAEAIAPLAIQRAEGTTKVNLYYALLEQQLERIRYFANKSHNSQEQSAILRALAAIKLKNEAGEATEETAREIAIAEMRRTGKVLK